jgi:hypothetical protein
VGVANDVESIDGNGNFAGIGHAAAADVVVASGGRIRLDMWGSFDQACRSLGPMAVNILHGPQGGTLSIERVLDYPNFNTLNSRSRCNTSKRPETRLIYQSSAGYVGDDTAAVEWIGPFGNMFRRSYRISVRPGVVQPPEVSEAPLRPRRHSRHASADTAHHPQAARNHDTRHRDASPAKGRNINI